MLRLPIRIYSFFRKNTVMTVAFLAAVITSFIVTPDKEYLGYFDLKTLACLFSVLAVVCALRNIKFFTILARKIVKCFGTVRMTLLALIYITFIGSMLIANDMALLTFLPLGYFVLSSTGMQKYMAVTFIMQNIAANLGGMLTPFGNPQNLYLYSRFNIPTTEFVKVMFPPFMVAIVLITAICLFFPNEKMKLEDEDETKLPPLRTVIYLVLFALSIAIVFRTIPYYIGLVIILVSMLFLDRDALKKVDYPLLLTFTCFFVFSGNMGRIEAVRAFFSSFLEIDTLLFSAMSCQFISNVPSAILLSQFTENWQSLLVGVNIGGAGTLIASLASLITFSEYQLHDPRGTKKYIGLFSAFNFGFLIVLYLFSHFVQGV
ncbi:MAG: citrate transporter [Clostridia bacterium]|nr:citrate transporter [Clostridia bacterium]